MNRRTFLVSSLAAVGAGLFLPKKAEAHGEEKVFWIRGIHGHNLRFMYDAPLPGYKSSDTIFLNWKDGDPYLFDIWYDTEQVKDKRYIDKITTTRSAYKDAMTKLAMEFLEEGYFRRPL